MKTMVYVDGFNMYYGCLKGTAYKWLDLCALFQLCLPAGHQLVKVKYFTARVSGTPRNPGVASRQQTYLRALQAHSGAQLEIIEGRFQVKKKLAPLASAPSQTVRIVATEEKGSDVNLAVELVHDAWLNNFDCAAVVSNDADLERALRIAKQALKKTIVLYTPGGHMGTRPPVASLTKWSHKQFNIDPTHLAACQLPASIAGTKITKPTAW